ncbi:hypothetical protein HDV05_007558 [Chytridiales sp. JEL 0842]|nr:hypothetical protein HDV05_007558 [Chytridiales sp. JEL 0842]
MSTLRRNNAQSEWLSNPLSDAGSIKSGHYGHPMSSASDSDYYNAFDRIQNAQNAQSNNTESEYRLNNNYNTYVQTRKPNTPGPTSEHPLPPFTEDAAKVKSQCSKASIKVSMDRLMFVAGGDVSGKIELKCIKDGKGLKLGDLVVSVVGFEDVLGSKTTKTISRHLILYKSSRLQGTDLAPTDAIIAGVPDEHSMYPSTGGTHFFPFTLRIDNACLLNSSSSSDETTTPPVPSSFWSQKAGGVRYILSAILRLKINNAHPQFIVAHQEIQVVEHAPFYASPTFSFKASHTGSATASVGGWWEKRKGEVKLGVEVHVPDAGQEDGCLAGAVVAGGGVFVGVEVGNWSKRKITAAQISLIRRLKTFTTPTKTSMSTQDPSALQPVTFSRLVVSESTYTLPKSKPTSKTIFNPNLCAETWAEENVFLKSGSRFPQSTIRGSWGGVKPGEKRNVVLEVGIPIHCRSVRFGLTVDVSYILQVSVTPKGSSPITVEIPVTILHPTSLLMSLPPVSRKFIPTVFNQRLPVEVGSEALPLEIPSPSAVDVVSTFHDEQIEQGQHEEPFALAVETDRQDSPPLEFTNRPPSPLAQNLSSAFTQPRAPDFGEPVLTEFPNRANTISKRPLSMIRNQSDLSLGRGIVRSGSTVVGRSGGTLMAASPLGHVGEKSLAAQLPPSVPRTQTLRVASPTTPSVPKPQPPLVASTVPPVAKPSSPEPATSVNHLSRSNSLRRPPPPPPTSIAHIVKEPALEPQTSVVTLTEAPKSDIVGVTSLDDLPWSSPQSKRMEQETEFWSRELMEELDREWQ